MKRKTIILIMLTMMVTGNSTLFAKRHHSLRKEIDLGSKGDNRVIDAIKNIEHRMNAKVYRFHLERRGKRLWIYEIHAMSGDTAVTVQVDAESGQIMNATNDGVWAKWTDLDVKRAAREARLSMGEILRIGLGECGGNVLKAKLEITENQPVYDILFVTPEGGCGLTIEPSNGDINSKETGPINRFDRGRKQVNSKRKP